MPPDLKPSTPALPQMTLREYAAIQITAAMLSRHTYPEGVLTVRDVCKLSTTAADTLIFELCRDQADAMIAALKDPGDA